jgi:hypothetical protein
MAEPGRVNPSEDDERDLINAEFESLVSGLSLDQSSPRSYLDELDEIDNDSSEKLQYSHLPQDRRDLNQRITSALETIKRWWRRGNTDDNGDGAVL